MVEVGIRLWHRHVGGLSGLVANVDRGIRTSTSGTLPQVRHNWRSTSTLRNRTGTHSLYCNTRKINCLPLCRIWQGSNNHTVRNFLNSMLSNATRWQPSGCNRANHALMFQANAAITMYAQLLSNVLLGSRNALTPFFNCSI